MNTILFNHLKQSLEKKFNGKKWIPEKFKWKKKKKTWIYSAPKWNPYQVAMNSAQDNTTFQMFGFRSIVQSFWKQS